MSPAEAAASCYPFTGYHSQPEAEHQAAAVARRAWADPDACGKRQRRDSEWGHLLDYYRLFAFSDGGIHNREGVA